MSLLYSKRPDELQFVFIDPKKVELGAYNRIGNYLAELKNTQGKVVLDTHEAMAVLDALDAEMDNRFRLLYEANAKNIAEYNNQPGHGPLPYIVVVIDEFADLAIFEGEAFESKIRVLSSQVLSKPISPHASLFVWQMNGTLIPFLIEKGHLNSIV